MFGLQTACRRTQRATAIFQTGYIVVATPAGLDGTALPAMFANNARTVLPDNSGNSAAKLP